MSYVLHMALFMTKEKQKSESEGKEMFINEFNIDNGVVAKAQIGLTSEKGFSGVKVVTTPEGAHKEEFFLFGERVGSYPLGQISDQAYVGVRGKLNLAQYNLFDKIREARKGKTYLHFGKNGFQLRVDEDEDVISIPFRSFSPINNPYYGEGGHSA